MSEFIGSRISLVSRSDIRYVGTLHEINSETSTVALENVSSFGTEGRKGNPEDEIAPSDNVYEYIVFRGSDVKDLRIEEAPAVKENKPPQVPNDPAILGTGSRPQVQPQAPAQAPVQQAPVHQKQHQGVQNQGSQGQGTGTQGPPAGPAGGPPGGPPQFPQHPQYPPQFYPPPPGQWGRGGPPGPGYPGMPYGAPPGWYPPPGQPPYGPYGYGAFPPGPPGAPGPPGFPNQSTAQQQRPAPIGPGGNKHQTTPAITEAPVTTFEKSAEGKAASKSSTPTPAAGSTKVPAAAEPAKPAKPATKEAAPPAPVSFANVAAQKAAPPTGPKATGSRIIPAVPLQSLGTTKIPLEVSPSKPQNPVTGPSASTARNSTAVEDATKVATAAVAAAMAKLPPLGGQQANGSSAVDNLTKKVNELKTNDTIRGPRHPIAGGGFRGERFERGRGRGGRGGHEYRKIEVPTTDFDFESSNAKFNKEELVKEAGSPLGETVPNGSNEDLNGESPVPVPASYNKKSSFFDDLSSDNKDRAEGGRPGGREWRGEEQKKNLETFGQGSVDNGGHRGGYRGRGRGRGGMRGRGYGSNGQPVVRGGPRGGYRGGRGDLASVSQ